MAENILFKSELAKAMVLCSRREYCSSEILGKLLLWGVKDNEAEEILSILKKENYLNDSRYALAFVKDKFKFNKWGKVKIADHLRRKQISEEIISIAIESIDNEAYNKLLKTIIYDHKKSVKAKNLFEVKAKLLRYGLSKGFESALLYDLLNKIGE